MTSFSCKSRVLLLGIDTCYLNLNTDYLLKDSHRIVGIISSNLTHQQLTLLQSIHIPVYQWETRLFLALTQPENLDHSYLSEARSLLLSLSSLDLELLRLQFARTIYFNRVSEFHKNSFFTTLLADYISWESHLPPSSSTLVLSQDTPHSFGDYLIYLSHKHHKYTSITLKAQGLARSSQTSKAIIHAYETSGQYSIPNSESHVDPFIQSFLQSAYQRFSSDVNTIKYTKEIAQRTLSTIDESYRHLRQSIISGSDLHSEFASQMANVYSILRGKPFNLVCPQQDFILICLQVMPECNSNPLGQTFHDQLSFIEAINDLCLAHNLSFVVREHPHMLIRRPRLIDTSAHLLSSQQSPRSNLFYHLISRLSAFAGFSDEAPLSSYLQSPSCTALATVAGTSAIEALVHGKTVLLGSQRWYSYLSKCYHLSYGLPPHSDIITRDKSFLSDITQPGLPLYSVSYVDSINKDISLASLIRIGTELSYKV